MESRFLIILSMAGAEGLQVIPIHSHETKIVSKLSIFPSWLERRDSNPRMVGPEPTALPLGDAPINLLYYNVPYSA